MNAEGGTVIGRKFDDDDKEYKTSRKLLSKKEVATRELI